MISSRLMLILAQGLLVVGAFSMILAAVRLFDRALAAGLPQWNLYWIIPVAVLLGVFKAVMVMRKHMVKNISRLRATTTKLWFWQIYPVRLLIFILSMVLIMNVLKRVFVDNAIGLGALGGVDVAVAAALIVASAEYRKK
jgi:hypothetical protein